MKKFFALLACLLLSAVIIGWVLTFDSSRRAIIIYPVIVPHFDTFKTQRQEFLKNLAQSVQPSKIILMSVDHYNYGEQDISSMTGTWRLRVGDIELERDIFAKLIASGIINNDKNAFVSEHGIKNVIPDLVASFPKAEILPVMVKDGALQSELDRLYKGILDNCQLDCLVVGSVDFSHYNPNSLAQIHDTYSVDALNSLSESQIRRAETDSPNILTILARLAKGRGAQGFKSAFNSNSGAISGDNSVETTSVVIGQFASQKSAATSTTLMFADGLASLTSQSLDQLGDRVFWGINAAIADIQGTVSAEGLKFLHIDAVNLAAVRQADLVTAQQILLNNNFKYFGDSELSYLDIGGEVPVRVFGVDLATSPNFDLLKLAIISAKQDRQFVIVSPVWDADDTYRRQVVTELIQAGADAIIGSGPILDRNFEIVSGKPVVYSLGGLSDSTTKPGLIAGLNIKDDTLSITLLPTKEVNSKPRFMRGEERKLALKKLFNPTYQAGFAITNNDTLVINRTK